MTNYVNSPIKIGLTSSLSGDGHGAFSAYGFPFNMNHITAVNDKSEACWGEFCSYPKATSFITVQVVPACSTNTPTRYRVGSFCTNTHAKTHIRAHIMSWERQLLFLQGKSLQQAKYLTFFILLSSSSSPHPPPPPRLSIFHFFFFFPAQLISPFLTSHAHLDSR